MFWDVLLTVKLSVSVRDHQFPLLAFFFFMRVLLSICFLLGYFLNTDVIRRPLSQRVWFWVPGEHYRWTIPDPNQCVCKWCGQQRAETWPLVRPHQGFPHLFRPLESTPSCVSPISLKSKIYRLYVSLFSIFIFQGAEKLITKKNERAIIINLGHVFLVGDTGSATLNKAP